MSTSIPSRQAQGFRLAGYFCLAVALLSTFAWVSIIHHDYVMEHRWPATSGTITSRRENSRVVHPPSSRSRDYWLYWAEFDLVLDLPVDRCPGEVMILSNQPAQCTTTVRSPATRSRANAIHWLILHPLDSKMAIHYDLATSQTFAAGESIIDLYPWYDIGATLVLTMISFMMFAFGRKLSGSDNSRPANATTSLSIE